jgi:deoxyribose-phosphate aldolase
MPSKLTIYTLTRSPSTTQHGPVPLSVAFKAVCVPPNFVGLAVTALAGSAVSVATVIGFPFGYSCCQAKVAEAEQALADGAHELDVVACISDIKAGRWEALAMEVATLLSLVRASRGPAPRPLLKVIIESGVLTDAEIEKCCAIYGAAGIDFLKVLPYPLSSFTHFALLYPCILVFTSIISFRPNPNPNLLTLPSPPSDLDGVRGERS